VGWRARAPQGQSSPRRHSSKLSKPQIRRQRLDALDAYRERRTLARRIRRALLAT
jgi:hypothetical protein